MTSLRRTALVWTTILLAVVGALAALIAYAFAHREAAAFLDSQLRQIALNAGEGLPETAGPPVDHEPEDEFSVTIFDAQGRIVRRAPPHIHISRQSAPGFSDLVAGGDQWRVYTSSDGERTVQVAQRTSVREELAASAALDAAMPILIVIPLSWIMIGWVMNRLLRGLKTLGSRIAGQSAHTNGLVPLDGIPQEIVPLVEAMNALTARLRAALSQQRQFVADAAHELRTPLAALQVQVDGLARAATSEIPQRRAALAAGIQRCGTLVRQLLQLARLEDSDKIDRGEEISVVPVLLHSIAGHVPLAENKSVDIGLLDQSAFSVVGVREDLRVLFDNLLDNAVKYTAPGGTVDIFAKVEAGVGSVEFVDSGLGIPSDAMDRIFDRFFRAAPADTQGTGLGLAIVHRIAERHGYTVTVSNRSDGKRGAVSRVVFPKAGPSPRASQPFQV